MTTPTLVVFGAIVVGAIIATVSLWTVRRRGWRIYDELTAHGAFSCSERGVERTVALPGVSLVFDADAQWTLRVPAAAAAVVADAVSGRALDDVDGDNRRPNGTIVVVVASAAVAERLLQTASAALERHRSTPAAPREAEPAIFVRPDQPVWQPPADEVEQKKQDEAQATSSSSGSSVAVRVKF